MREFKKGDKVAVNPKYYTVKENGIRYWNTEFPEVREFLFNYWGSTSNNDSFSCHKGAMFTSAVIKGTLNNGDVYVLPPKHTCSYVYPSYMLIYESEYEAIKSQKLYPVRATFCPPATIVWFNDGSKTVVKCQDEKFDPEKGIAMALLKRYNDNKGNYFETIKSLVANAYIDIKKLGTEK